MFKKIPTTTATVLGKFRKAIDELESVAEAHLNLAEKRQYDASEAANDAAAARKEAEAAQKAAERLQAVFG